jgi:transducin (beta)-like 1
MSVTSDELNYLIYRYMQESGFTHSAFSFGCESQVIKANINGTKVPPGMLVSFVQKGLQFAEIEHHLQEDGHEVECMERFSLIAPHTCRTTGSRPVKSELPSTHSRSDDSKHSGSSKQAEAEADARNGVSAMDTDGDDSSEIRPSQVLTLEGHTSEVFICAWNPCTAQLASGSGDSTARIWTVPSADKSQDSSSIVLNHSGTRTDKHPENDVTTLDWNQDGSMLATGSYDGQARIWNAKGQLLNTLNQHKGPIFSLKWNKKADYLLSGSVDKTAIVWDVKTGEVKQQFQFHEAPTLDVDWKNNVSFATCSTDKMIYVCKLGDKNPLKTFKGHQDEVNAIKWDPSGQYLASCSDDCSAKIWTQKQDTPVHDFQEHQKEIYTIKWSPTGPGTNNPNQPLMLASASFDATIKIWNVTAGQCVHTLTRHSDPVYSVAFSPNGEYIASGSFDKNLHIWAVKDGSLVKTFKGDGGIFEVCWNSKGDKVAACFSNNTVCVLDTTRSLL